MSVPVLLTVLDNAAAASEQSVAAQLLLDDEHMKSCASFLEAATILTPAQFAETPACTTVVNGTAESTATAAAAAANVFVRKFTLLLANELEPKEHVGLTGDSVDLGEWQLEHSISLQRDADNWLQYSAVVNLQQSQSVVNYRYFIYTLDKKGKKQIRRWETQTQPRQVFGSKQLQQHELIDRFGMVGENMAQPQINRGWLTNEHVVQLKFEREKMFQVLDIDKFDTENLLIRIVPLQEQHDNGIDEIAVASTAAMPKDDADNGVHVEVAKLKYAESQLQPQSTYGIGYTRGDVIIFHVTVPNDAVGVVLALVFHSSEQQQPLGKAFVRASQLLGSEGVLELNITEPTSEATRTIARLTLPYLIIRPFTDAALNFRTTYAHYWPQSWPKLDVGHRGNGKSYVANPPDERENTIASFLRAYEKFADMIELDVHLTADGVPIIYHDFSVRTAPKGKVVNSAQQLELVLIKDLTYEALKELRIFAVIDKQPVEFPSHNSEARLEHRIFPTLVEVLEQLPKTLGIDVEIKWPQLRAGGGPEAVQTIDKNFFIDRVLSIIIKYGCGRPLVFSSFDADICSMLRFKQNLWPVMFLTQGETKKWEPFMDLRTRNFEQAINNAQAFELAGTAPHAEDFLGDNGAQLMQKSRQLGQIALVWGDDCNSKERVKYFSEIGATATCYDRTDLYVPEGKERAFFNCSSVLADFEPQCRA